MKQIEKTASATNFTAINLDERKIEDKRLDLDEILAKIQKNFKKADIKDNLKIIVEPPKREIRELRLLADKFRDLQISGIKDIGKVIIRKDYKNGEPTKYQNRGPQGSHPLH